jgi:anti-sigma regulatory factor (Ser/Thr protein kinase)
MGTETAPLLSLRFEGTLRGFEDAFGRLREELDRRDLEPTARYKIELVFEEIVANIVRHGMPEGGKPDVRFSFGIADRCAVLVFDDDGVPFDPRGRADPAPARSLEEARIGGLGLMMVRKASQSMDYVRTAAGRNVLTIVVPLQAKTAAALSQA